MKFFNSHDLFPKASLWEKLVAIHNADVKCIYPLEMKNGVCYCYKDKINYFDGVKRGQ